MSVSYFQVQSGVGGRRNCDNQGRVSQNKNIFPPLYFVSNCLIFRIHSFLLNILIIFVYRMATWQSWSRKRELLTEVDSGSNIEEHTDVTATRDTEEVVENVVTVTEFHQVII